MTVPVFSLCLVQGNTQITVDCEEGIVICVQVQTDVLPVFLPMESHYLGESSEEICSDPFSSIVLLIMFFTESVSIIESLQWASSLQ